jgi:hypothetical protein
MFRFGSGFTFAAFVFGSLSLAACGAPAPGTGTASTADSAAWVVTDSGIGPIAVGMTAAAIAPHIEKLGELQGCVYAKAPAAPGLLIMLFAGKVVRVDVIEPGLATAAGARVGDTEARIRELYAGRVSVEPHKYTDGHYLVVDSASNRRLVFETDGTRVTRYRAGVVPQVDWVEGCS